MWWLKLRNYSHVVHVEEKVGLYMFNFFVFVFQAYAIVGDTIDKMQFVFEEIVRNDASRPALRPKQ